LQAIDVEGVSAPPVKALLLDDSNFDRARIRRLSDRTHLNIVLDEVGSIAEMDDTVRAAAYDLILIDYRLPVGDGLTALGHIHLDPLNRDAGKIMITGDAGTVTAVTAMRRGCHDFLTKDAMTPEQLRTAMLNAISPARERRALKIQTQHQQEIIRLGLKNALEDDMVQNTVVTRLRKHIGPADPGLDPEQSAEIDALIIAFGDDDEFIFH